MSRVPYDQWRCANCPHAPFTKFAPTFAMECISVNVKTERIRDMLEELYVMKEDTDLYLDITPMIYIRVFRFKDGCYCTSFCHQ